MKATDLMIGDWIYNSYHKKNIKWDYPEMFLPNGKHVIGRDLEPIPLTEEILKANSLTHKVYCHEYDEWVIEVETHYSWWLLHIYHTVDESYDYRIEDFPISYVHELQHALRLCGLNDLADNFKVE